MKKNGFIATSILYSFFLVFISLFVALIANYMHNRILLQQIDEASWEMLLGINETKLSDMSVGDHIRFSTSTDSTLMNEEANWVLGYKKPVAGSTTSNTYYFISDTIAVNPTAYFKLSLDSIPKQHNTTLEVFNEINNTPNTDTKENYNKCFEYYDASRSKNFSVRLLYNSLLEDAKNQTVTIKNSDGTTREEPIGDEILNSIFNVGDNYVVYIDKTATDGTITYPEGSYYDYRIYNFELRDQQSGLIPDYCGGVYNTSTNTVTYNAYNTFGYIHLDTRYQALSTDKLLVGGFVDYCTYASPIAYEHYNTHLVVSGTANCSGYLCEKKENDLISSLHTSTYPIRVVASITLDDGDSDTYIAGGKGTSLDPYLFTNGVKQQ